ncbi:phage capsid protein [Nicoliella lavandulae]|uniref:Phage capsid protein n=1 Tax=Nicoliella lavandulae TaxID=3082954 RepID=A0ABU8SMA7_9LACO
MASPIIGGNVTNLAKNFVPQVWLRWVTDHSTRTNRFLNSGVATSSDELTGILGQPGNGLHVTIPHIHSVDLSLPVQDWNNQTDLFANGINSYTEEEIKFTDAQMFGSSDYDDYLTGAPTLDAISQQFAEYWANIDEKRMIQVVNAAFLNQNIATAKGVNIGNAKMFDPGDVVLAMGRMGDVNGANPSTIAVNSGTYAFMRKQNLIEYLRPSDGGTPIATYQGMAILQDDDIPLAADGTTTAYIFAPNALVYSTATAPNGIATVRDETHQGGITGIKHERISIAHVYGTSADLSTGASPENWKAALADSKTPIYKPVSDDALRQIRIIKYDFKITPEFVVPGVNSPLQTSGSTTSSQVQTNRK